MKLFIINLARSTSRKARMQSHLDSLACESLFHELGLRWEFFEAIDSSSHDFYTYRQKFSAHKCYMLHSRVLIDSEIACYASHYRLWQECVQLGEPIIVLEDDISFKPHFLSALQDIMRRDFGLVRFYTLDRKRDKYIYQISDSPYHYSLKNTNGTQGYYLHPRAARALLAQECWDSPVDIQMEFVARHGVDNIIYKPFPIAEDEASSAASTIINPDGSARTNNPNAIRGAGLGGGLEGGLAGLGGLAGVGGLAGEKGAIPLYIKLLKPFYRNFIMLRRALFKLTYTPPKPF